MEKNSVSQIITVTSTISQKRNGDWHGIRILNNGGELDHNLIYKKHDKGKPFERMGRADAWPEKVEGRKATDLNWLPVNWLLVISMVAGLPKLLGTDERRCLAQMCAD